MPKMIARKGFTYGTRRLLAEEPFETANRQDAKLLSALGRARYATTDGRAAIQPVKAKITKSTRRSKKA